MTETVPGPTGAAPTGVAPSGVIQAAVERAVARLEELLSPEHVLTGDACADDYGHDECLTVAPVRPACVVRPGSTEDVAAILTVAGDLGVPVTARGSGTGLSGRRPRSSCRSSAWPRSSRSTRRTTSPWCSRA